MKTKKAIFKRPTQKGNISEYAIGYILRESEKALLVDTVGENWIPKSVLTTIAIPVDEESDIEAAYELAEWFDRKTGNKIF